MKPTAFSIQIFPYGVEIFFSFNQTDAAFKNELVGRNSKLSEHKFLYEPGKMSNTLHCSKNHETIVRFVEFKRSAQWYGFLAHEIFHAVELIFKSVGIKHHYKYSSEVYAYQIDYVTEQVFLQIGV